MSWNRSNCQNRASSIPAKNDRGKFVFWLLKPKRNIFIILLLAIIGIIVVLNNTDESIVDTRVKSSFPEQIKTVTVPQKNPAAQVKLESKSKDEFCFGMNNKVQTDKDGKKWLNGARFYENISGDRFDKYGNKLNKQPIFKHKSENVIAGLLTQPIGMHMAAAPNKAAKLDQDFLQSLFDPTEILDTDSEEDKKLKNDVMAAKKEIVQRIKAGENFNDIIEETRREYNRLANLRDEMRRMYNELKKEGATQEQLDEHIKAANILLERNGVSKLPVGNEVRDRLRKQMILNKETQIK